MKKKIISLIISFLLFLNIGFCFPVLCNNSVVYASQSGFPDGIYNSFVNDLDLVSDFYNNPSVIALGFTRSNSLFSINQLSRNSGFQLCAFFLDDLVYSTASFQSYSFPVVYSNSSVIYQRFLGLENLDSFSFSLSNDSAGIAYISFSSVKYQSGIISNNGSSITIPDYVANSGCLFYRGVSSFVPDGYDLVNPFFSLDVDDFYTWLVNNDKIQISGDSGGVSVGGKIPSYIGTQKLKSFLNFYKNYGASNKSFVRHIVEWFSYMNIVGQTKDNINVLKSTTDYLYQEYINYRSGNHAYWPTAQKIQKRQTIDTVTDDDNTTLITDDNSDTLDISILRDILRGVIAISNNVIQGTSNIVQKLDELNFTVNVANDGGSGFDYNSIWGTGDITQSENYLALTSAFMDKGVDVSAAENLKINYLDNASQQDSFTVSVVMPDQYVNGSFTEKTVTHTIDNTSKMYNTLLLFRKLIAFAVIAYFAIRIRFELPHLIRGE